MKITKIKNKKTVQIILFGVGLLLVALSALLAVRFNGGDIHIGAITFPVNSLNGSIQTLVFVVCIGMVLAEYKRGRILALIVMTISLVGSIRAVITSQSMTSLPGTLNALINIIAIFLIANQIAVTEKISVTDYVTDLTNRYGFEAELQRRVAKRQSGAIIYLHLEGFLFINANLGRRYGDIVLHITAQRILKTLGTKGKAYKIDGAEYAILLSSQDDAIELANKLIESVEEALVVNVDDLTTNCYMTAFAGIVTFGEEDKDADALMINADIAMNHATKSKDTKICIYNEDIKKMLERQVELEGLIKEALEKDYFYLVYQPQFTIAEKRLRGFETLIRMRLPDGTVVPPGEFIAAAEKSDLILDIDALVLRRAMVQFKDLCLSSGNTFTISINISAKDISTPGFAERLLKTVERIGFPAECLEIEITEYSFADSMNQTIENIQILRENNILIALDDFGTGYTSLEQIINLPVNLLKIDKSLIDNVVRSELNRDFIKTVIYMGHLMDCEVIAEGVENEDQLTMLERLGCDFIQGFVWSRPLYFEDAAALCYDAEEE